MSSPWKLSKDSKTNGTIWHVKHAFVEGFVYKRGFAYVIGKICRKENVKILMKNWLVKFIKQEMWISHAKILIKHFRKIAENWCSMLNLIQIFILIVALIYGPNIHMELWYTFLYKFLWSKPKNNGAMWSSSISSLINTCGDKNFI